MLGENACLSSSAFAVPYFYLASSWLPFPSLFIVSIFLRSTSSTCVWCVPTPLHTVTHGQFHGEQEDQLLVCKSLNRDKLQNRLPALCVLHRPELQFFLLWKKMSKAFCSLPARGVSAGLPTITSVAGGSHAVVPVSCRPPIPLFEDCNRRATSVSCHICAFLPYKVSPAILHGEVCFSLYFAEKYISAQSHSSSGTLLNDTFQLTRYFWLFQDPGSGDCC